VRSRSGLILTVSGFLACPCHLPLTLPWLLALLGGTSLGLFLRENTGVIVAAASVYFLVAIVAGLVLLNQRTGGDDHSPCCPISLLSAGEQGAPDARRDGAVNPLIRS
jgi:mercuric ion transport protein